MCGFVGFTNHIDNSNVVLGEMLDKIKHRGPDAEGTYIDEDIALGHRRLSIIDVSEAGTQPLYSGCVPASETSMMLRRRCPSAMSSSI